MYQPSFSPPPLPTNAEDDLRLQNEINTSFLERLGALRKEEIQRGITTCGPHRDELRLLANGIDLGDYGSRGQMRTALLALKLAEVEWMKKRTGESPLLLLDETLAELDPNRRSDLLLSLQNVDQAILTATDLSHFTEEFIKEAALWKVSAGSIKIHIRF